MCHIQELEHLNGSAGRELKTNILVPPAHSFYIVTEVIYSSHSTMFLHILNASIWNVVAHPDMKAAIIKIGGSLISPTHHTAETVSCGIALSLKITVLKLIVWHLCFLRVLSVLEDRFRFSGLCYSVSLC